MKNAYILEREHHQPLNIIEREQYLIQALSNAKKYQQVDSKARQEQQAIKEKLKSNIKTILLNEE